jgi:hypothetical protein
MKLHIKSTTSSQLADKLRDRTMIRCAFFAKKTGVNSKIKTKDTHKKDESEKKCKWMPPEFTRVTSYTVRSRNRDLCPE